MVIIKETDHITGIVYDYAESTVNFFMNSPFTYVCLEPTIFRFYLKNMHLGNIWRCLFLVQGDAPLSMNGSVCHYVCLFLSHNECHALDYLSKKIVLTKQLLFFILFLPQLS